MRTFGTRTSSGAGSLEASVNEQMDGHEHGYGHVSATDVYARHLRTDAHAQAPVRRARSSGTGSGLSRVEEDEYGHEGDAGDGGSGSGGGGRNSVASNKKGKKGTTTRALTRFVMGKH